MPFDNRHAPIDSPHLTGEPTSPTPGVADNGNRIATTGFVQAIARKAPPANQPIELHGDVNGRGTTSINATVRGFSGRPISSDAPADTEVFVWSQQGHIFELVPACQLGQQSDGNDLVQVSDGAGGFTGLTNHVTPGAYTAANVTVDEHGLVLAISSGTLDSATIPDAPSDNIFYGRHNAAWGQVAPLDSPIFTGDPRAPTPPAGDNDTTVATTAFVQNELANAGAGGGGGIAEAPADGAYYGRHNTGWSQVAPLDSPVFTGNPTAPTAGVADNDTTIATTAFVKSQNYLLGNNPISVTGDATGTGTSTIPLTLANVNSGVGTFAVQTVNAKGLTVNAQNLAGDIATSGAIATLPNITIANTVSGITFNAKGQVIGGVDQGYVNSVVLAGLAPLASPAFTGNPTAPTPLTSDADTSIATTAFVAAATLPFAPLASPAFTGNPTAPQPPAGDNDTSIATTAFVQNLVGGFASIASPLLTGDPRAPTPAPGDADTSIATTAFVANAVAALPLSGLAPLANPIFTGDPRAPTPAPGDNDTSIATTAFVATSLTGFAPLASPLFTGDPRAPTPVTADNDTSVATTAFVKAQGYLLGNQTVTLSGDITGSGATGIAATVQGIRGRTVSATAPLDTQVYAWNAGLAQWQPTTPSPGSAIPAGLDTQVQFNNAGTMNGSSGATFSTTALTSMQIGLPGSATGDIWFRNAAGAFTRLPAGAAGTIMQMASGLPSWQTVATGSGTVSPGGVGPQIAQYPTGTSNVVAGVTLSGDATIAQGGALTLTSIVTPGTISGIQFDSKGRVIAATDQGYLTPATAAATYLPLVGGSIIGTTPGSLTVNRSSVLPAVAPTSVPVLWGVGNTAEPASILLDGIAGTPAFMMRLANGTAAAPTPVLNADVMGQVAVRGRGATGYSALGNARVQFIAAETFTDTAQGTFIQLQTTQIGASALTNQARVGPGITVGTPTAPTGGMLIGDVNASRLMVNGVPVATGGIAEAPIDGTSYGRNNATWVAVAPLASPVFTGNPTAPTPSPGDNDASIATTAFVVNTLTSFAPLASPLFTGDPRAPTPTPGDNDTSVATTAFVSTALSGAITSLAPLASPVFTGNPTAPTAAPGDSDTSLATTAFVTNAVTTSLTGFAPIASPVFTGNPTAPTPPPGDNDTSIATTAFIATSYLTANAAAATYAPILSPVLTGNPQAPTPATLDNDTSIATTAFVKNQAYLTGNQGITVSGDVSGVGNTAIAATVLGIQGRSVAAVAPANDDVLTWNQGLTRWEPKSSTATGGTGLALAAVGTNAATALVLTNFFNEVTNIAPGTGVRIPTRLGTPNERCRIAAYDTTTNGDLLVYPLAGQTFYYGGVSNGIDGAITLTGGYIAEFQAVSATKIYVMVFS